VAIAAQCPPCIGASAGGKRSVVSTRVRGAAARVASLFRAVGLFALPSRGKPARYEGPEVATGFTPGPRATSVQSGNPRVPDIFQ
jgi:hypothetical protein